MAKDSTFEDPWTPLKELAATVEAAVLRSQPGILNDLESVLKKHKPTFIGLLKNAPRSSADAALVKKAATEGKVKYKCDRTGCPLAHMCRMTHRFIKKIVANFKQ